MMHQPVEYGVSEGGIAHHLMPVLDRQSCDIYPDTGGSDQRSPRLKTDS
jgi:hypothetical protein